MTSFTASEKARIRANSARLSSAIATLADCDAKLRANHSAARITYSRGISAISAIRRAQAGPSAELLGSAAFLVLLALGLYLSAFL